jgi:hypothetical protein
MLFGFLAGVQGSVASAGVNEFVVPNHEQTWEKRPEDRRRPCRLMGELVQTGTFSNASALVLCIGRSSVPTQREGSDSRRRYPFISPNALRPHTQDTSIQPAMTREGRDPCGRHRPDPCLVLVVPPHGRA